MTWYKTGTVSVAPGSNAVIGTGTAFIRNARVGDAFRGPDGEWYEVTNIASDTALSIAPGYQGAAATAGVYSLAPMQGYVKDSADALRAATQVIASGVADMQEQVATATDAAEAAGQSETAATDQAGIASAAAEAATNNKDIAQQAAQQSQQSAQASTAAANLAETARDSIIQSEQAAAASATASEASADLAEAASAGKASSGDNNDIKSLRALTLDGFDRIRHGLAALVGASASSAGDKGLVPAPAAGPTRFLSSLGTWLTVNASAAWGEITGNISDQADLQSALDATKMKRWRSGNLSVSANATNLPHGLGQAPDDGTIFVTLTAAAGGWPTGSIFRFAICNPNYASNGNYYGVMVANLTSSTYSINCGSTGIILNTTAGASVYLLPANCTIQLELLAWN